MNRGMILMDYADIGIIHLKSIKWWDKLDANRERKEREHEIGRSAVPLECAAGCGNGISEGICGKACPASGQPRRKRQEISV
ncbi:MAG: hypothetical protein NC081_03460 [Roseburia sp.]|nr:hypothetical protein [Roseburia sp.]